MQLYIAPPATYSETTGAPYGAGHCNFSDDQRVGLISVLDRWVRDDAYPAQSGIGDQLGVGYDAVFSPGPWPGDESS